MICVFDFVDHYSNIAHQERYREVGVAKTKRDDEMADSFQNEVPKARINLKLDLHTGGASKKMELPLKLLVAGDFSNGQESAQISEREKVNITKNNFDSVLSEYSPKLNLTVKNTLSDDGGGQHSADFPEHERFHARAGGCSDTAAEGDAGDAQLASRSEG
jgi:hypothetical protein